jgi:hypothetical protein
MVDGVTIATGAVNILSPFLPYLVNLGQGVGKKLEEVIAEKGGDTAWKLAESLWNKISRRFSDDEEVTDAAKMVARAPENGTRQEVLAEELAKRLQNAPDLAQELTQLMGGEERVNQITAGDDAWMARLRQTIEGAGKNILQAGNRAIISCTDQDIRR